MENKINIAELLKDCPKGTKLYSPICGRCFLENIGCKYIEVTTPTNESFFFHHNGRFNLLGEIMLFPEGKITWEGFQKPFKDGDFITSPNGAVAILKYFDKSNNNTHCYCGIDGNGIFHRFSDNWSFATKLRISTEDEKEKLFQAIKDNGYKWNPETKTLEKLVEPKFKVGDKIKSTISSTCFTITDIKDDCYYIQGDNDKFPYKVPFMNELNYELVPNKFDITTLIPFESKVLVRDMDDTIWIGSFFTHTKDNKYYCVSGWFFQCIPYEGNEHLLGTIDDCDEYYKTWE